MRSAVVTIVLLVGVALALPTQRGPGRGPSRGPGRGPSRGRDGTPIGELSLTEQLALAQKLETMFDEANLACVSEAKVTLGQAALVTSWGKTVEEAAKGIVFTYIETVIQDHETLEPETMEKVAETVGEQISSVLTSYHLEEELGTDRFKGLAKALDVFDMVPEMPTDTMIRKAVDRLVKLAAKNCDKLITYDDSKAIITDVLKSLDTAKVESLKVDIVAKLRSILPMATLELLKPKFVSIIDDTVEQLKAIVSAGEQLTEGLTPSLQPALSYLVKVLGAREQLPDITPVAKPQTTTPKAEILLKRLIEAIAAAPKTKPGPRPHPGQQKPPTTTPEPNTLLKRHWPRNGPSRGPGRGPSRGRDGTPIGELSLTEQLALAQKLETMFDEANLACVSEAKVTLGQAALVTSWGMTLEEAVKGVVFTYIETVVQDHETLESETMEKVAETVGEQMFSVLTSGHLEEELDTDRFKGLAKALDVLHMVPEMPTDTMIRKAVDRLVKLAAKNCDKLITYDDSKAIITDVLKSLDTAKVESLKADIAVTLGAIIPVATLELLKPKFVSIIDNTVEQLKAIVSDGEQLTEGPTPSLQPALSYLIKVLGAREQLPDINPLAKPLTTTSKPETLLKRLEEAIAAATETKPGPRPRPAQQKPPTTTPEPDTLLKSLVETIAATKPKPRPHPRPGQQKPPTTTPEPDTLLKRLDETELDPLGGPTSTDPCRPQKTLAMNIVMLSVLNGVEQMTVRAMLTSLLPKEARITMTNVLNTLATKLVPDAQDIVDFVRLNDLKGTQLDKIVTTFHEDLPLMETSEFRFRRQEVLKTLMTTIREEIHTNTALCSVDVQKLTTGLIKVLETARTKYFSSVFRPALLEGLAQFYTNDEINSVLPEVNAAFEAYRKHHLTMVREVITELEEEHVMYDVLRSVMDGIAGAVGRKSRDLGILNLGPAGKADKGIP